MIPSMKKPNVTVLSKARVFHISDKMWLILTSRIIKIFLTASAFSNGRYLILKWKSNAVGGRSIISEPKKQSNYLTLGVIIQIASKTGTNPHV